MTLKTKGEGMTVVTFKTKTEVFEFLNECKEFGIRATLTPIPKEIKIGCGLSVSISLLDAAKSYSLIVRGYFPTFNGIFTIKRVGAKTTLIKKY